MTPKILLLVLDGVGDLGKKTPLEVAKKPNIDSLASKGKMGFLDIGYKKHVNSDVGYLTLLSSFSEEEYPGRGYLEALGIGLKPKAKDICIRANFATIGPDGNLVNRRAGREETELDYLAECLDGTEIDGVRFTVKHSAGHRIVIVLQGPGLSLEAIPNDPYKIGVPVPQVGASAEKAKKTASVLNKFLYRANKILSQDPANKKRKFPANTILVRNLGRAKKVPSFKNRYGLKAACVAGIPIAKGVARFLGMGILDVKGATGMPDTNLAGKMGAAIKALKKFDLVFLHINGTDILSHSGDRSGKTKFLEKIDKEFGRVLKAPKDAIYVVTCDHRTCSLPEYTNYRHTPDPVPILISGDRIKSDGLKKFDEKNCEKGSLKLGKNLIPFLVGL